ncbi:LysR family transcriptional regulator [Streptomyces sp. NBC_01476]|uniref:LysR family transcriptional regulator n=1 Tax=Streptomyces sp. NBC_01476 TaxID=2903881 RepID=UPI002E36591D|nr:LysR family transcriptional regulator [Streptomyces sp. NBC_01476]
MESLETREMTSFVAVAEALHFGDAAERLGTTQPALSRAIARLERRLGVSLFDRTTRRVSITPAGEVFLSECRRILADIEGAVRRVRRTGEPERLLIAVRPGTGQGALAEILSAYRREPGSVPVDVVFTYDQEAALRDGSADLALTCQTARLDQDLEAYEVGVETPVALLPATHPLARRTTVTTADLLALEHFTALTPLVGLELIADRVALGELVVITGASARDRLSPSVAAVPVADSPAAWLHLAWLPTTAHIARDELLRVAKSLPALAGHGSAS